MKQKHISLTLALLVLTSIQSAIGQVATVPVNQTLSPETIARQYALNDMISAQGVYNYVGVVSNQVMNMSATFTMQIVAGKWGFTQMNINGIDLPIDPHRPLRVIPPFNGVVTNFSLNFTGYDSANNATRYGWANVDTLKPNEEIEISITLNFKQEFVPFKLPPGLSDANVGIVGSDGYYGGWYDAAAGGFRAYYDPINPPTSWLIVDERNGSVIGSVPHGGSQVATADAGHGIVFKNQWDGPELHLDSMTAQYQSLRGLTSNPGITRNGTNYDGMIGVIHMGRPDEYFTPFVSGAQGGSIIEIYGYDSNGDEYPLYTSSVPSGGYQVLPGSYSGYSSYQIVVIGEPSNPLSGFGLDLYDTSVQLNFGIGKGVATAPHLAM